MGFTYAPSVELVTAYVRGRLAHTEWRSDDDYAVFPVAGHAWRLVGDSEFMATYDHMYGEPADAWVVVFKNDLSLRFKGTIGEYLALNNA